MGGVATQSLGKKALQPPKLGQTLARSQMTPTNSGGDGEIFGGM